MNKKHSMMLSFCFKKTEGISKSINLELLQALFTSTISLAFRRRDDRLGAVVFALFLFSTLFLFVLRFLFVSTNLLSFCDVCIGSDAIWN